jgi:hypothetical protein
MELRLASTGVAKGLPVALRSVSESTLYGEQRRLAHRSGRVAARGVALARENYRKSPDMAALLHQASKKAGQAGVQARRDARSLVGKADVPDEPERRPFSIPNPKKKPNGSVASIEQAVKRSGKGRRVALIAIPVGVGAAGAGAFGLHAATRSRTKVASGARNSSSSVRM